MSVDIYSQFKLKISQFIPAQRIIDDPLRTLAYATDASFYRLVPKIIVKLINENEVSQLLQYAQQLNIAVTFRAAGTSLSGQAISDSILLMLEGNAWRQYEILANGELIRLQPGIIGAQANTYLAKVQRKIGPDPASIATAKIGGIAANNASGMCCGVSQNSYQTLQSMRIVFADGSILDTGSDKSKIAFQQSHSELLEKLEHLSAKTRQNQALAERIHHKYQIKNTTGYSLNALIDFTDAFEILQHLLIGSEGTLGFISEITYQTVADHPHKASALIFFKDIYTACQAVTILKTSHVNAVELMDRASLRAVEDKDKRLSSLADGTTALLIETHAESAQQLETQIEKVLQLLASTETLNQPQFTTIANEYDKLWQIRKGMFPSIGKIRTTGTTVIIEDIAFPLDKLAQATIDLQHLFEKHGYNEAIIFGHALEGNLHFVITQDFSTEEEIKRYDQFTQDVCHLVVDKYDGSLKAEHSTGRNMAPFVELEWGKDAYLLMQQIKDIFDADNILNPGVILNQDAKVHIKNLKPMPKADALIDRCIECGFCEPICPSRNLSLTPRQRIVILREMARLEASTHFASEFEQMYKSFQWYGNNTCAADGLCATQCPVDIDTGAMIKSLRHKQSSHSKVKVGNWINDHIGKISTLTRAGLKTTHVVSQITGPGFLEKTTSALHKVSAGTIPVWHRYIPKPAKAIQTHSPAFPAKMEEKQKQVVYFPSCISRSMGVASCDNEQQDLHEVMQSLFAKSHYTVIIPEQLDNLCCGLPFSSKGLKDSATKSAKKLEAMLWQTSNQGEFAIVCDTSPCTAQMIEQFTKPLKIYEPVEFIYNHLLQHMRQTKQVENIALHITCSAKKMKLDKIFMALAKTCANNVFMPEEQGCCGFAGDKGFLIPELNQSALSRLKQQIPKDCTEGYSNSRSCEIGLSRHSGIHYRSIAYLVDKCFSSDSS